MYIVICSCSLRIKQRFCECRLSRARDRVVSNARLTLPLSLSLSLSRYLSLFSFSLSSARVSSRRLSLRVVTSGTASADAGQPESKEGEAETTAAASSGNGKGKGEKGESGSAPTAGGFADNEDFGRSRVAQTINMFRVGDLQVRLLLLLLFDSGGGDRCSTMSSRTVSRPGVFVHECCRCGGGGKRVGACGVPRNIDIETKAPCLKHLVVVALIFVAVFHQAFCRSWLSGGVF